MLETCTQCGAALTDGWARCLDCNRPYCHTCMPMNLCTACWDTEDGRAVDRITPPPSAYFRELEQQQREGERIMSDTVKVMGFKVENFKRVELVEVTLNGEPLVIGGENGQGKTSLLDALCVLLGGAKLAPTEPIKDGSDKATIVARFSNGVTAERRFNDAGKTYLYVNGVKGGQDLLDAFVSQFALDVRQFMEATDPDRSKILLKLGGLDLDGFAATRKTLFDERTLIGRERDKLQGAAAALPFFPEADGKVEVTDDLFTRQLHEANEHNAGLEPLKVELERVRARYQALETESISIFKAATGCQDKIERLQRELAEAHEEAARYGTMVNENRAAMLRVQEEGKSLRARIDAFPRRDTAVLIEQQAAVRELNRKIQANAVRARATAEATAKAAEYDALTARIEQVDADRTAALQAARLPLQRMSIADDGQLLYGGKRWDGMSESERLICAAAVGKAMKPEMGFVLIDGCEKLSRNMLAQFLTWCQQQNIQPIMTRVSDGPECGMIIEDGRAKK